MKTRISTTITLLCILAILLAACQSTETPTPYPTPSPDPARITVGALQAENDQLATEVAALQSTLESPPTSTPTATITPTPTATATPGPTVSVPENLAISTHEGAPGFVFPYDPEVWSVENTSAGSGLFLQNNDSEDCEIGIAGPAVFDDLLQYYPRILGRRAWLIEGYEDGPVYTLPNLRVSLSISEDDTCLPAQEVILEDVLTQEEYDGAPTDPPAVLPTTRPTPDGFVCEGTLASRLRIGDKVFVTAGFLWLRKDPIVDDLTNIRLFQQYAPANITITDGPICADGFIFWQVLATLLGEGGETFTGWMAEAGAEEYYLDIWYLDR